MRAAVAAIVLASLAAGCASEPPGPRTVEDRERGYRFVLPAGWRMIGYDARSDGKSLLTIDVHSLVGADPSFVAGLPRTILPQLEGWTLYYFVSDEPPVTRETEIGGRPAFEAVYRIRVRPADPPSLAEYWVVRNDNLLYILRATYPPGLAEADGEAVREILASWRFLEATSPAARPLQPPPSRDR